MMSCLSASRGYPQRTTRLGIKSLASSCPPTQPQPQPQTSQSACSSAVSDGKCSISSSETSSSPVVLTKKPRSRRRRPHEIYNEAAAALSAVYPKIFSCPPNKQRRQQQQQQNNSNSTAIAVKKSKPSLYADDDSELLQEVPTFVRRARDMELLLFCNQSGAEAEAKSKSTDFQRQVPDNSLAHSPTPSSDAKSQSQSQSEIVAMSPSCVDHCCDWDDSSTVEYDCLLDSEDAIDVGIMSAIMGDSGEASSSSADNGGVVPDAVAVAVFAGEAAAAQQRLQCSAIRSLRRMSDCMSAPLSDFHGCSRLRILDRVMADRYKNSSSSSSSKSMMSLCSLDWLKAEVAAAPRRLKLKLNYEDVLNAWSDRGPLFADDSAASPHFGFEDSAFGSMAAAGYGYDWVPDMSFWRSVDENGMYGQMDDRACCGEDGMLPGSGVREASVLRYKEKRRTRLFSKKIRYEVRKLNAERRPRMKGRFVRRLSDI